MRGQNKSQELVGQQGRLHIGILTSLRNKTDFVYQSRLLIWHHQFPLLPNKKMSGNLSIFTRLSALQVVLLCSWDCSFIYCVCSTEVLQLLVGGVSQWLTCALTWHQPNESRQEEQGAEHVGGSQSAGRHTGGHIWFDRKSQPHSKLNTFPGMYRVHIYLGFPWLFQVFNECSNPACLWWLMFLNAAVFTRSEEHSFQQQLNICN